MSTQTSSRFWLYHAVYPLLAFVLLAVLFEKTGLDLVCSDSFFDFTHQTWKFKDAWWAEGLLHLQGRKLVLVLFLWPLAVWVLSFFRESWRPWRRTALYVVLAIGLGTGSVALGKEVVNRHCPWDYARYGGDVAYGTLFDPPAACCSKGRCFPAGHAAAGFSLMSGYFIYQRHNRRKALGLLAFGFSVGTLFSFAQVARGAHFVSHNLWSLAICWFVCLGLYAGPFGRTISPPQTGRGEGAFVALAVSRLLSVWKDIVVPVLSSRGFRRLRALLHHEKTSP
jgi:membrane-associated PAP2 superfamily phosphatase